MARPREYDDDLRRRLVGAATRLLVEEGPTAVTTRRVAAEVGTTTAAIYTLVGSKDDLLEAIRQDAMAELAARMAAAGTSDDVLADLRRLAHVYLDVALENAGVYPLLFGPAIVAAIPDGDDAGAMAAPMRMLLEALQRAIDAGVLRDGAPTLAWQLFSLTHGLAGLATSGLLGPPAFAHQVLDDACTTVTEGLLAGDPDPATGRARAR